MAIYPVYFDTKVEMMSGFPKSGKENEKEQSPSEIEKRVIQAIGKQYGQARDYLQALAEASGGTLFVAESEDTLGEAFARVSSELRNLYTLGLDGQSEELLNIRAYGGGSGPAVMAASPAGEIFIIMHGPYAVLRIAADGGHVEEYVRGVYGDPWGMAVSLDGAWLYVAESGVIDAIPIDP